MRSLTFTHHILGLVATTLMLAIHVGAQDRDLEGPHDASNLIDCQSCHVPFGVAPSPLPQNWISNMVCRSCHIEGGSATPMDLHRDMQGNELAQCTDCHNPHQHQASFPQDYIRSPLHTPNSGIRPLEWRTATDFLHGPTGANQPYDGICESCHTQTDYHRNNASGDHEHNRELSCTTCHQHSRGFQGGACDSCHGAPPATGAHLTHFSGDLSQVAYGLVETDLLSTPEGYTFACGTCHPYDLNRHMDGVVDVELANASAPAGSLKALSPATASYLPGSQVLTDPNGLAYTLGSCSNVYCHSSSSIQSPGPVGDPLRSNGQVVRDARGNLTYASYPVTRGTQYRTVGWGEMNLGCSACHLGMPRTSDPLVAAGTVDSHSWLDGYGYENLHSWNKGYDALSCRSCHFGTVTQASIATRDANGISTYSDVPVANRQLHVNGVANVDFDPVNPVVYTTYSGVSHSYSLAASRWQADSRTCSSVPCHLNQTQPEWGKPYRWYGTTEECDQCHRYADSPATGHPAVGSTVHNLSSSGPGTVKSTGQSNACVFCHSSHPHGGSAAAPQWNRLDPAGNYSSYGAGGSMQATPALPGGSSRPCLSCHDGNSVIGQVRSQAGVIPMAGVNAQGQLPTGAANLGLSFANDHPFSFIPNLADPQVANPPAGSALQLDASGKLQCGTCHESHDNSNGDFLVAPNTQGALCVSCHNMQGWAGTQHGHPANGLYPQMLNQACTSCHQTHSAAVGPRLLRANEETLCYSCHDGAVNASWEVASANNIVTQFNKTYKHPVATTSGVHNPGEGPTGAIPTPSSPLPETSAGAARHVDCSDCHNPHGVSATNPTGGLNGALAGNWGITSGGAWISPATFEYQICLKCHGDSANKPAGAVNMRTAFQTTNPSHHAVFGAASLASTVPSLIAPWTTSSVLKCGDCHGSDSATGAQGVHGSTIQSILKKQYYRSFGSYSATTYALCYTCHNATVLMSSSSFSEHNRHVRNSQKDSCIACHSSHGSTSNHLMKFNTSLSYIQPSSSGRLEFIDTGTNGAKHGTCYVTCHGENHNPETY